MARIDYYVRLPMASLGTLLGLVESQNCSITSKVIADNEVHLNIAGDWDSYKAIADAKIAHSLEHFEDDN